MNDAPKFPEVYAELGSGKISPETIRGVFDAIFAGSWTPVQTAAFVAALRVKGESAETITAAAQALRGAMIRVEHGFPRLLDTCGTGGDGLGTVNLSTGAAILVAAAGVPVAKHGNRAASSRTGSADVLEALGIPLDLPPDSAGRVLREANIAFLLAPVHHPAMRHAAQVRRELGIRTIFNCLGPLANPASATHQLVGVPEDALRPILAGTLRALGTQRAWVVRGREGLDEVSPCGPTRVSVVEPSGITEVEIAPEDFGLAAVPLSALEGGDAAHNAGILERILRGEPHPSVNGFVLNAAAALVVAENLAPRAAADRARALLESGAAHEVLEKWRAVARTVKNSAAAASAG
jgi:anthranilate phosphoribosyltransferase